ncbi:MAG: peptide chain release factor 1 [Bacilli bacterium]|nr:peptide chain release factor 1 [Bacilli bacterium]
MNEENIVSRLENIKARYEEINNELMRPEVLGDIKKTRELSKEQSSLSDAYEAFNEYNNLISDMEAAKEMVKDPDMASYAKEELETLKLNKDELLHKLEILLLPKDPNDGKNVIVEIRGAAGGDEANIFAGDLYDMYTHLAEKEGWKIEVMEEEDGTAGGFTLISFMVKGDNVYSKLKYESGAHRVQRVPVTESQGRVQTSTATVLVMPEAEEVDVDLDMNDVRIDITRSSGCGGQGVNTTDSAVRLTHIPTGLVVYSQTERSQIKNKEKAIKILQTRLADLRMREAEEAAGVERRSKIGTGDRSEKIRTYNYPQNRVTDHRIGFTINALDRVMAGDIDKVIEALITEDQARKLRGEESID